MMIEPHPDRYPRHKTPAEVNTMLQQYEQLPGCRNDLGRFLRTALRDRSCTGRFLECG
jgi:hypothetical protein